MVTKKVTAVEQSFIQFRPSKTNKQTDKKIKAHKFMFYYLFNVFRYKRGHRALRGVQIRDDVTAARYLQRDAKAVRAPPLPAHHVTREQDERGKLGVSVGPHYHAHCFGNYYFNFFLCCSRNRKILIKAYENMFSKIFS